MRKASDEASFCIFDTDALQLSMTASAQRISAVCAIAPSRLSRNALHHLKYFANVDKTFALYMYI